MSGPSIETDQKDPRIHGATSPALPPLIALTGGPAGIARLREIDGAEVPERVTVDFHGRHVHFERGPDSVTVDGRAVPVFQWIYTTAVAE